MGSTFTFPGSNWASTEKSVVITDNKMSSNYTKTVDEPTMSKLKNKTTGLDTIEQFTYKCKSLNNVGSIGIPVLNKPTAKDGVIYTIDFATVLREEKTDGTIVDHPIEMWLNIKHDISAPWTTAQDTGSYVAKCLQKLLGACYQADGSERFDSIAKSALIPTTD